MNNIEFDEKGYVHFVDYDKATEYQKFAVFLHNSYIKKFVDTDND